MNILVNAASIQMGGGLTYLKGLLRSLSHVGHPHQFTVCVTEPVARELAGWVDEEVIALRPYPFAQTSGPARVFFDQVLVPRLARQLNADVLFSATGFGTFVSPCPQVLMLPNPIYFTPQYKGYYTQRDRGRPARVLRRWWTLQSIRTADLVTFPTAAMKDMVADYITLDERRAEVVTWGFDADEFLRHDVDEPAVVQQMRGWKEAGYAILLNVSLYSEHKNFGTAIDALPHLLERGLKVKFVLTVDVDGPRADEDSRRFVRRIRELGLSDSVVFAGRIPHEQVLRLYQAADLFVFPSFTESFGYPMVEAMLAGLPSVAADTAINREVLGESALFFETFSVEECAQCIARLLEDRELLAAKAAVAKEQAAQFSWDRHAVQFLGILDRLADRAAGAHVAA